MINYCPASTIPELQQILELQQSNLSKSIGEDELKKEGFVTATHDLSLLQKMNTPYPHAIAKDEDKVVGYALVMLSELRNALPVLVPMFDMIDQTNYQGNNLGSSSYFVMGQVCIDKAYRGKGIFKALYEQLKTQMSDKFDWIITEISKRNTRSLHAHSKVGFKTIKEYTAGGEEWVIVLWDWS